MTTCPFHNLSPRTLFARTTLFLSLGTLLALPPHAESLPTLPDNLHEQDHPRVIVTAEAEDSLSGKNSLDALSLAELPMKEGSINEALLALPGVQRPNSYGSSTSAGEILSPEISISGGKFYENQIQLEGVSINRRVDPANTINSAKDIPGNVQAPTISTSLLGHIELYRYNIPASYGGFTGGIISASVRTPKKQTSLMTSYRTTSDSVTEFHIDPDDQEDFYSSSNESQQPRFRKHDWQIELDLPISAATGALAAYHQAQSKIPLHHLGGTSTQRRRNENVTFKLSHELSRGSASLTGIYAPYTGEYFREDTLGSDYTLNGGGLILAGDIEQKTALGTATLTIGFTDTYSDRDDVLHHFSWAVSPSKPWGGEVDTTYSLEGGYGDIVKGQTDYTVHPAFTFTPYHNDLVDLSVATGFEFIYTTASFERPQQTWVFSNAQLDTRVVCDANDVACVDSEQYLARKALYDPSKAEALMKQYSVYLESIIALDRFSFRPGIRFSNESLTENHLVSPRLAVAIDALGDGTTILRAGANRYHSSTPVTFKLREAITPLYKERRTLVEVSPGVWQPSAWVEYSRSTIVNEFTDLETPYVDELAAGLEQQLASGDAGVLTVDFIRRDGRDEITKEFVAADKVYRLNNNGRSRHLEYSLGWELLSEHLDIGFNATYQDNRSSHADYDDFLDDETADETVWYEGEAIPRWELPSSDYNRPWIGNLLLAFRIPTPAVNTTFSNLTRYTGHYRDLEKLDTIPAEAPAEVVDAYEVVKVNDVWTFDWKLGVEVPLSDRQSLTVSLEAYNVFNAKTRTTSEDSDYYLGRQFWAGLSYQF